jgi:hypothetical protein
MVEVMSSSTEVEKIKSVVFVTGSGVTVSVPHQAG